MWGLEGGGLPRTDGLALARLSSSPSLGVIFQTRRDIPASQWHAIVIHDSGSVSGTPQGMDAQAISRNLAGLPYHFVIGNGRGIGDGEIYVGYRWLDQLPGAHVSDTTARRLNNRRGVNASANEYNQHSIAVCLIGDADRTGFSRAQIDQLARLLASLCRELDIDTDRVYLAPDLHDSTRPFPAAQLEERLKAFG